MTLIQEKLFELQDKAYADFQRNLTPGIDQNSIIGVRVPKLRAFAKEFAKKEENRPLIESFLQELPHTYYDENLLHGIWISEEKDYEICLKKLEAFLPYVDNWAVCDTMKPKPFKKNKERLLTQIRIWSESKEIYTCRFGMEMLMNHYLDDDFKPEYLEIPAKVRSEEYYVNMMTAWFFATALAKQWEAAIPYIEKQRLDRWTHNKAIQKARESYRITPKQKEYLKTLKV